jgi:hypothetical protein
MQSDKYICIRDSVGGTQKVGIIDMADPMNPARRPTIGSTTGRFFVVGGFFHDNISIQALMPRPPTSRQRDHAPDGQHHRPEGCGCFLFNRVHCC